MNLSASFVCCFTFVSGFIVFHCAKHPANNCLFLLSKKFSTRVLQQIYVVVRRHPPITLCNKPPSRRERERERNGLGLPGRANLVNIYRNHQSWCTWSLQRSFGSTFSAHSGEEWSSERQTCCVPSQETALETGLDELTSLVPHADFLDIRCLYGAWQQ